VENERYKKTFTTDMGVIDASESVKKKKTALTTLAEKDGIPKTVFCQLMEIEGQWTSGASTRISTAHRGVPACPMFRGARHRRLLDGPQSER